ncbi:MAG: cysteine desulfurase family protein [Bdellovibrionota bacterium]
MKPVYLDYNAATPIDRRVLDAALPYMTENFGNPSSVTHSYGWDADSGCRKAREQVAKLMGVQPKEIYFTSGATESNNLAIQGVTQFFFNHKQKVHLITTPTEHKAVIDVVKKMGEFGAEMTILKTNKYGQVSAEDVKKELRPHTRLVSVIHGNNEIGSLNPIREIGQLCRENKVLFHSDAAQTVGKVDLTDMKQYCDLLSSSGQKMYGPKGIGFLFVREEIRELIQPVLFGGSQERGLRPGTLNVPAIVGLGEACRIFIEEHAAECSRLCGLRDQIIKKALALSSRIRLNGHPTERLCNNINLTIQDLSSDLFALGLSGIAVSGASACSAGAASHVLKAIGHSDAEANSSLRIGIGRMTTDADADLVIEKLKNLLDLEESFKA